MDGVRNYMKVKAVSDIMKIDKGECKNKTCCADTDTGLWKVNDDRVWENGKRKASRNPIHYTS